MTTIAQARAILDDPHACTDASDVLCVLRAVFDTLVCAPASPWSAGFTPSLATAWAMSDDARSTTFELRDDVRFHDGTVCDAEAVADNIQRMSRPDMGATLGAGGVYAQYLEGVDLRVLDRHRLRVTTVKPLADLFDILSYGHMASPCALNEAASGDGAQRMIGTGPYRLTNFEDGRRISLQATPAHFSDARTGTLDLVAVATAEARLAALAEGRAEVATVLPADAARRLAPDRFTTSTYLVPMAVIFMFNAAAGPGADRRVRLALNLAIDRDALVRDVLGGLGQPLHGFVSPVHDGADPTAPGFACDRDTAKLLLREAGFGAGLDLHIACPTRLPDEALALVDAVERQLAGLGVRFIRHIEQDRVQYANNVRLKKIHDICVFDSSPMSAFRVLCEKIDARVKGSWWEGYGNPAVEALIDRGRQTVAFAPRMAVYREAYRLLQADPPWLYLYNHHRVVGVGGRVAAGVMPRDGVLDVRALPAHGAA